MVPLNVLGLSQRFELAGWDQTYKAKGRQLVLEFFNLDFFKRTLIYIKRENNDTKSKESGRGFVSKAIKRRFIPSDKYYIDKFINEIMK